MLVQRFFCVFKLRNVEDNWGLLHTGILRHSFSTRLLYSVLPSQWYAKNDASIDQLHDSMATDFCKVFEEGISVDAPGLLCNIWHHTFHWGHISQKMFARNLQVRYLSIPAAQVEGTGPMTFWGALAGAKGDWPWVRKAFHLASGFRSLRKCHLCPSNVT